LSKAVSGEVIRDAKLSRVHGIERDGRLPGGNNF